MFLGMRGTGDWVDDQRPMNWRENILYLYPNGMTPNGYPVHDEFT